MSTASETALAACLSEDRSPSEELGRRRGADPGELAAALSEHVASLTRLLGVVAGSGGQAGPPAEELLTLEDVAQVLRCSPRKCREWVMSYVRVVRVGDLVRVRRADLDQAVRRLAAPYGER